MSVLTITEGRLARAAGAVTTTAHGRTVLLDADYSYLQLNETAQRVWELLEEPRTISELVSVLAVEFDVDRRACRAGLASLIFQLLSRGVVIAHSTTGSAHTAR